MSLRDLREGLAANLDTIPDIQTSAYILSNPTPPYIQTVLSGVGYDQAMHRGHDDVTFTIQAVASRNAGEAGQQQLDRLLENVAPYSVKLAVEADKTLGGACDDLAVTEASGVQILTPPTGGEMLVLEWTVLVLASGTT